MGVAAELTVSEDGFSVYDDLGKLVDVDIFGYFTRTPGFLFYPTASPSAPWVWESNNEFYTIQAEVSSVTLGADGHYHGTLTALNYYKVVEGQEVSIGRLSIAPVAFQSDDYYSERAAELGRLIADYVSANGMSVTGSDGVDNFSGDNFGLNATISWTFGAGDDWLNTRNQGVDIVDGGLDDDHIETLGGNDIIHAGGGVDFIDSGEGDDVVYAGSGNDTASLGRGNDKFYGEAGNDEVFGWEGNDLLDGGAGDDILYGGEGNDTYIVDSTADVVIEGPGEGDLDRVSARKSYVLASDVHVELMTTTSAAGTAAINLYGNSFAQEIVGNAGQNMLKDGGGAGDLLRGGAGNDTYLVYSAATRIVEGAGQGEVDRVSAGVSYVLSAGSQVEQMTTTSAGGTSPIALTGNEFAQMITGNAGANRLEGKGGADQLRGLGGADTFVFATKLGGGNIDTILDFSVPDDRFLLSDNIFTALTPGTLKSAAFKANITGLADDASDRIIYEIDTGKVFYDADGTGAIAGVQFAVVTAGLSMTHLDFSVA